MRSTPEQIFHALKQGAYAAVYFLQGPETYYIDQVTSYIEQHALLPSQKSLNCRVYYGKEHVLAEVLSHARCVPMMGTRKVVIVKEAQEMRALQHAQGRRALIEYIAHPNLQTVLVFAYKYKTITHQPFLKCFQNHGKQSVLLTTQKIYLNHIPRWVYAYVKQHGYTITPQAVAMLQSLLGTNLSLLANGLRKIMLNLKTGGSIDQKHIATQVGMQREINSFELQRAIGAKEADKAFHILTYMSQNEKQYPVIPLVSLLTTFFLKILQLHYLPPMQLRKQAEVLQIHPYFMKEYQIAAQNHPLSAVLHHLQALHKADLQLKGIDAPSLSGYAILQELISCLLGFRG